MPKLLMRGKPVESVGIDGLDAYARERWECVVLDLFESLSEYMPMRTRWIRMNDWVTTNKGHEKWRSRKKQEIAAYTACLGQGGSFDRLAKVLQRLGIAHRQLSTAAILTITNDYGTPMAEEDHPFWTNLWIENEITNTTDLLNAWAIAKGGHNKQRTELRECPF